MQGPEPLTPDDRQREHDIHLAAFNQNAENFRSLNQLMWQIPLIAMTLTGGLWFGVSRADGFIIFQYALLFLAAIGNLALIFVLHRIRFVMGCYLNWLKQANPKGFVQASGAGAHRSFVVRTAFQIVLFITFIISCVLLGFLIFENARTKGEPVSQASIRFYESHARSLADGYEAVSFEDVHTALQRILEQEFSGRPITVLDVGAGTGRDAAWLAARGHLIVAVEPSPSMRKIGQALHPAAAIEWLDDTLPSLSRLQERREQFDLIIMSAVWMHVRPPDRAPAMRSALSLLAPGGFLYMTLRIGPDDAERGIYPVSLPDLKNLADGVGAATDVLDENPDLLGRHEIRWVSLRITPAAEHKQT